MKAISRQTLEHIEQFLSRECEYAGTQEVVDELVSDILMSHGINSCTDEIILDDGHVNKLCLEDFINEFWDVAMKMVMNVLETEELDDNDHYYDRVDYDWNEED